MKMLLLSLITFLSMNSNAQVGSELIAKFVKDDFSGDLSIAVETKTEISTLLKAWGFSRVEMKGEAFQWGWNQKTQSETVIDTKCEIKVTDQKEKIRLTVSHSGNKENKLQADFMSVEIDKSAQLVEILQQGLEHNSAMIKKIVGQSSNSIVLKDLDPALSLSWTEGILFVELGDGKANGVKCGVVEKLDL